MDENVRTWWKAGEKDAAPWLLLDLGTDCTVNAVQVNFADDMGSAEFSPSMLVSSRKRVKKERSSI